MDNIYTKVFLRSGSSYTKIFFNDIELDTYYEDNKHLVDRIERFEELEKLENIS